jgi:hypothetical protein
MAQRQSGYERQPDDVYQTPDWVTRIIAPYLRKKNCVHIWDPANGPASQLAQSLRQTGFEVVATNDDFLARISLPNDRIDCICTNPPYGIHGKLACEFIAHAIELAPTVAMLLRVDFDSGKTRTNLFRNCEHFVHKIVLLDRIVWFEREDASGPSDNHAWFVWHKRGRQRQATNFYAGIEDAAAQQKSRYWVVTTNDLCGNTQRVFRAATKHAHRKLHELQRLDAKASLKALTRQEFHLLRGDDNA